MSSTSEDEAANRRHVRFQFGEKAELIVTDDENHLHGTMLDLSKLGCLLALTEPCDLKKSTRVEILFSLNGQALRVGGEVRARRSDTQIGIQFDQVEARIGRQLGTLSSARSRGKENRSADSAEAAPTEANNAGGE